MPEDTSEQDQPRRPSSRAGSLFVIVGGALLVALAVVAVVLIFRGGGNSASVRHNAHQPPVVVTASQVTVKIIDNDFQPSNLTVKKGTTVTWRSAGNLPHTVTEDRNAFASKPLTKDATFEHRFDAVGTFYYYCIVHHIMTGSVTVTN
jgi:plastocyanin